MKNFCAFFLILMSWCFNTAWADFSSPAAKESFSKHGDISLSHSEQQILQEILNGKDSVYLAARSSGCSSSCSSRCSSSCSNTCSTRCASGSSGSRSYTPSRTSSFGSNPSTSTQRSSSSTNKVIPSPTPSDITKKKEIDPDEKREIYWEDGYKWLIHNSTCPKYARGKGTPLLTPTGSNCPSCGGTEKTTKREKNPPETPASNKKELKTIETSSIKNKALVFND